MVNGSIYFASAPNDLRLQGGDAFVQLVDRQGIEVLPPQLGEQVVLATRKIFVGVHGPNVDRARSDVNKATDFPLGRKATNR